MDIEKWKKPALSDKLITEQIALAVMLCTLDKFSFSIVFFTKTCSDIQTLPVETNLYYVFD